MGTRQLSWSFDVPTPPERVGQVLCSESYAVEEAGSRPDVASASYRVLRRAGDELEFEVAYLEYGRTMTGGIDRSRTSHARTVYSWDGRGTLRWEYTSGGTTRINISGVYRLAPSGDGGTRVSYEVQVEVRVPLVGGTIAGLVARELEQSHSAMVELLTRHATRPG